MNVCHFVNVEEGLESAGFEITTKGWLEAYNQNRRCIGRRSHWKKLSFRKTYHDMGVDCKICFHRRVQRPQWHGLFKEGIYVGYVILIRFMFRPLILLIMACTKGNAIIKRIYRCLSLLSFEPEHIFKRCVQVLYFYGNAGKVRKPESPLLWFLYHNESCRGLEAATVPCV